MNVVLRPGRSTRELDDPLVVCASNEVGSPLVERFEFSRPQRIAQRTRSRPSPLHGPLKARSRRAIREAAAAPAATRAANGSRPAPCRRREPPLNEARADDAMRRPRRDCRARCRHPANETRCGDRASFVASCSRAPRSASRRGRRSDRGEPAGRSIRKTRDREASRDPATALPTAS